MNTAFPCLLCLVFVEGVALQFRACQAIELSLLRGPSLEGAKQIFEAGKKLADNDPSNNAGAEKTLTYAGFFKTGDGQWLHDIRDSFLPPMSIVDFIKFASGDFLKLDSLAYAGTTDGLFGLEDLQKAIEQSLLSGPSLEGAKQIVEAGKQLADNDPSNNAGAEKTLTYAGFFKTGNGQWLHEIRDGVALMVLDSYQPNESGFAHGAATSYVAARASHAEGVEVHQEANPCPQEHDSTKFSELANKLKALSSSESPPEVINMSFGWSPATELMQSFRDDMNPSEVKALVDKVMKLGKSLAASPAAQEIRDALKKLVERGTTIIFSAGNEGEATQKLKDLGITVPEGFDNQLYYDDMPPGVIVVGGTDSNNPDSRAWSCTAPSQSVDVAADATGVTISKYGDLGNGTSFAAPQIAGLVADMKALDPSLTPAQIEGILVQSATPQPGKEALVGAGVVNREKALAIVQAGLATRSP